jgi:glycine/D-amino acid oxidase-like deaminating enzyme
MQRLRYGLPLWLDRPKIPARKYPRQKGRVTVDVVILGGGITGAICAYLFAEAGVRVALLESKVIGRGSTSASTALLMQEPDRDFSDLAKRFGHRAAKQIWKSLRLATRDFARTIRHLKLGVELDSCDSMYFTLEPRKVLALRREYRARKAAGLPGKWLSANDVFELTGLRAAAAILTPENAQVDPVCACHGFMAAAARRGAKVFERSQARSVITSKDHVEIETAHGRIRADYAVVATGYATPEFRGLVGRFRKKDTYVLVTRRLPVRLRPRSARLRSMAWDTDRPYHYLRWTGDGRLFVGGEDTVHRTAKGSRTRIARARRRLLRYLARVYPELAGERPEYAWEGLFAETPDGLPYIGPHSRFPRHLFALGYGGNGMTASYLAAKLLLDLYRGALRSRNRPLNADLFAFHRGRR